MCGIAGILKIHDPKDGEPPHPLEAIPEKWLDILDESIKHRGPDGQGRFRDRAVREDGTIVDVALVHRRLSIIDHEGGHQPMVHDGTRLREDLTYQPGEEPKLAHELAPGLPLVAVVFNGCIYNHRELRKELEAKGHVFETDHSDTEVLVHGWREWGERGIGCPLLLKKSNGMYAFSVWDRNQKELLDNRDAFGEKPLYNNFWGADEDDPEVSCSSAAGLYVLQPFEDDECLAWFNRGWVRHGFGSSLSGFEEISKAKDTRLEEGGKIPIPEGFGIGAWVRRGRFSPEAHSESEIDLMLRESVRRRLESDVPVGCFLSGGIDSSLIARYAKDEIGSLQTFTVSMPHVAYDEAERAREVAAHFGTDHQTIACNPDPAEDLVNLIHLLGLPFGDSSLLPMYWVCRAASRTVKVALSGDGADELFMGYERHLAWRSAVLLSLPSKLVPASLIPCRDPKSKLSKAARFFNASKRNPAQTSPELTAIFQLADLKKLIGESRKMREIDSDLLAFNFNGSPTSRAWDLHNYLTKDILRKTDTASMACPLEVRAPFLDPELAKMVIGMPRSALLTNGQRKGLLRQVARRYLPDHIVDRPKQGFAIPIGEWFRTDYGSMRTLLYDHLESADPFPGLAEAGVAINMEFVRKMLREHDTAGEKSINPWHGRDHSQRLYMLLVLSIWSKWLAGLGAGSHSEPGAQAT